eukprot:TRINITY_DN42109_c0_g1_i1.p1 TRINITY_DN42109_c0_g1~~TRINITY_DN42109_c0_g1_i1.p1  ORF type:complete len:843 (-),score=127.11 TRINITY_DN42109_c0_g1_i1:40-2568(-)
MSNNDTEFAALTHFAENVWNSHRPQLRKQHLQRLTDCGYYTLTDLLADEPTAVVQCLRDYRPDGQQPITERALQNLHQALQQANKACARCTGSFVHHLEDIEVFRSYSFVMLPRIDAYFRGKVATAPICRAIKALKSHGGDHSNQMLELYTDDAIHALLNNALRTRALGDLLLWQDAIYLLDKALLGIPPAQGVFYRGVRSLADPSRFTVGNEVCFSSVVSASADRGVALGFCLRGPAAPGGPYLFEMHFTEARSVAQFSVYPGEQEVCAPTLSRWTVVCTSPDTELGVTLVTLRQQPSTTLFHGVAAAQFPDVILRVKPESFLPLDGGYDETVAAAIPDMLLGMTGPAASFYKDAIAAAGDRLAWHTIRAAYKQAVAVATVVPSEHHREVATMCERHGYWRVISTLHDFDTVGLQELNFSDSMLQEFLLDSVRDAQNGIHTWTMGCVRRLWKKVCQMDARRRTCIPNGQIMLATSQSSAQWASRGCEEVLRMIREFHIKPAAWRKLGEHSTQYDITRSFAAKAPNIKSAENAELLQKTAQGACSGGKCAANVTSKIADHLAKPVVQAKALGCELVLRRGDVYLAGLMAVYHVGVEARALWRGEITWSQFKRNMVTGLGGIVASTAGGIVAGAAASAGLAAYGIVGGMAFVTGFGAVLLGGALAGMAAGYALDKLAKWYWNPADHKEELFNELRGMLEGATRSLQCTRHDLAVFEPSGGQYALMKQRFARRVMELHSDHMSSDTRTQAQKDQDTETLAELLTSMQIVRSYREQLQKSFEILGIPCPTTLERSRTVLSVVRAAKASTRAQKSAKEILVLHFDWTAPSVPSNYQTPPVLPIASS